MKVCIIPYFQNKSELLYFSDFDNEILPRKWRRTRKLLLIRNFVHIGTLAFHIAHPNQVPIKEESDLFYNTYPKSFVIWRRLSKVSTGLAIKQTSPSSASSEARSASRWYWRPGGRCDFWWWCFPRWPAGNCGGWRKDWGGYSKKNAQ